MTAGNTHCIDASRLVGAKQAAGCAGGAERTYDRRRVETMLVEMRRSAGTDPCHNFHSDDDGLEHLLSGQAAVFSKRQGDRNDGRAGMRVGSKLGIVELAAVAEGAVHEGGLVYRELVAVIDNGCAPTRPQSLRGIKISDAPRRDRKHHLAG